jgi:DNA-directed RNA polymerase specialized sigma24 family protein
VTKDPPDEPRGSPFDAGTPEDEFLEIYSRLTRYFRWRGCDSPEDLASETLYRALKQINSGATVPDLGRYCFGIAKYMCMEERKQRRAESIEDEPIDTPGGLGADDRLLLSECLNMIAADERDLLKAYYLDDREELAQKLSLTPTALRLRIFRIMKKIREQFRGKKS